jgi:hypothetical protein
MMKVLLKMMLLCGLVSLVDYTAMAQMQVLACPPVEKPTLRVSQVGALTGCPFSAVIQNIHSQTLADGTHVQTKSNRLSIVIPWEGFGSKATLPRTPYRA